MLEIDVKVNIGGEDILFGIDSVMTASDVKSGLLNECWIIPALVQIAQKLEYELTGKCSQWEMNCTAEVE